MTARRFIEAVIVLCNISEIYSNVLVSVSDGFSAVAFRPGLSGMDGHVAAEPGVYDFSIYVDEADQATIQRGPAGDDASLRLDGLCGRSRLPGVCPGQHGRRVL